MMKTPDYVSHMLAQDNSPVNEQEPIVASAIIYGKQFANLEKELRAEIECHRHVDKVYYDNLDGVDTIEAHAMALATWYGIDIIVSYMNEFDDVITTATFKA